MNKEKKKKKKNVLLGFNRKKKTYKNHRIFSITAGLNSSKLSTNNISPQNNGR
jgi:hypothetical protein